MLFADWLPQKTSKFSGLVLFTMCPLHRVQSTGGNSVWPQQNMASYALGLRVPGFSQQKHVPRAQGLAELPLLLCSFQLNILTHGSWERLNVSFTQADWITDPKVSHYISRWECSLRRLFTRGYLSNCFCLRFFPCKPAASCINTVLGKESNKRPLDPFGG